MRTSIFRVLIGGVCVYHVIKPIQIHLNFLSMPGMCVKTSSVSDKQKVFLNICQSQAVPPPPHLSQEALVKLLESEDPTSYRVPMSLGEPHTEVDNSESYNRIFRFSILLLLFLSVIQFKFHCVKPKRKEIRSHFWMAKQPPSFLLTSFLDKIFDMHSEYFYVCQVHKAVLCMMSWSMRSSSRNVRYVSCMWMKVPQEYAFIM